MEEIKNITFNDEMSERVDRFLRKEMSEAESRAFAEEVKTNPELKECYQRQFNLMRAIKFEKMTEIMKEKEQVCSQYSCCRRGYVVWRVHLGWQRNKGSW